MLTSVVAGGGDRQELALEVGGLELAPLPGDRALGGELAQLVDRVRGDQGDLAVAREQALDLLEPDLAAADDQAVAAAEPQAGDVERRLQHPADAALIADPPLVLADAFLARIGLGRHANRLVRLRSGPGRQPHQLAKALGQVPVPVAEQLHRAPARAASGRRSRRAGSPPRARCRTPAGRRTTRRVKPEKAATMMIAAAVMIRPVRSRPRATARSLSWVRSHSSRIRESRKTS